MANNKVYKYSVQIGVSVNTKGLSKGSGEVEESLSRWERRALKAIKSIEKALDQLNKVGEKVFSDNSRKNGGSSGKWTSEHKAVEKATQMINRYDLAIDKLAGKQTEVKKLNQQLSQPEVAGRINETTKALLRQKATTIDNIRESQRLEKQQEKLNRQAAADSRQRLEKFDTAGSGLQTAGIATTAALTLPIVAGFTQAIKIGAEYESTMNMLQAVTTATAEEMKKADLIALQLGSDLSLPAVSANDAAIAMTELAKGGMTVSQAMAAAKGTLQLATAAGIGVKEAAEITAGALNMFSLQASEAGRVANLLAGAASGSSVEIMDVAQSLQQSGSIFADAGVPIEDTITLIAQLGNAAIKGSDAGTSLKTMLLNLRAPTNAANDTMKALGLSVYDLTTGKMKPMRQIIDEFGDSLNKLTEENRAQALRTIFGTDAARAASILFKQGTAGFDKMKESVMRLNAAQELAAARTKGLGGAWEALKSQAETVGLIIYNRIKEPLTELVIFVATAVSKMTDVFVNLPEGVQQAIIAFTALAAAVGPILTVIGGLIVALSSVATGLTALTGAATVGAALSTLAPIIAGIGVVLAGLVAGLSLAAGAVYSLYEAWENGFGPIASIAVIAVGAVMSAISPILGLPVLIGAVLVTVYKIWTTNFAGIRDFIITIWNKIVEIFNAALARVIELVNQIGGKLLGWWRQNLPLLQEITQKVTVQIQALIQRFLQNITDFWNNHGETIMTVVNTIWTAVKSVVTTTVDGLLNAFRFWLQILNGDWSGAWQTFLKIIQSGVRNVVSAWKWLQENSWKALKWLISAVWYAGKQAGEGLVSYIWKGIKWLVNAFIELPMTLIKLVPRLIAAGQSIGSAIWNGIKEGLWGSTEQTSDIPSVPFDVNDLFKSPEVSTTPTDNQPNFLDKLSNSMKNLGDATKNTTGETTKFNKALDDMNNKSSKSRSKKAFTLADASLPEILAAMRSGTAAQESGGRLNARNKRTGALGLFQVMPDNIPEWTRNTPGVGQMTADEFRRNPEAQRKVFDKYMGEYLRRAMQMSGGDKSLAVRMAAAAWYGGPDDFSSYDNPRRFRPDEPSFREYTTKVLGRTRGALRKTRRGDGSFEAEKSLDQLADESIFNDAKQRVQALITLSKELGVALQVPTDVTTTNQELILQQQKELRNLQDLKKKREDVLEIVQRLGLNEKDYARETVAQADESLKKLSAIDEGQKLVNSTYDDSVAKLEEMRAATDGALTPLEEFNLKFERLQKNSGLSREEFEKLNPKLAETRQKLQEIADLDFENKLSEKLKTLGEDISKEIARIQAETARIGKTDAEKRALDRQAEIDEYIKANKVPESRRGEVEKLFNQKYAALEAQESAQKAADATALYTEEVKRLNEALTGNVHLTEAQKLEIELTTGKLKDLTDEQKNHLRILQQQADAQAKVADQYNETYDFIRNSLEILTDSGTSFGDKMKSIFGGIYSSFKKLLLDMLTAWITSKLFKGFGINPVNTSQQGHGGFGGFFDIIKQIFTGGRSSNRNASNQIVLPTTNSTGTPNIVNSSGGGANPLDSVIDLTKFQNQVGFDKQIASIGANIPVLTTNATPTPLGGAMRAAMSGLPQIMTAGVSRGGSATPPSTAHESVHALTKGGGIFGGKFGFNSGTIQGLGMIAGLAGSVIGGPVGGVLMGAASGIGMMSGLASLLGISSLGGPVGLAIGAAIGGVMALGNWLFGRNKQRRQDERTRNQAMVDAFAALDKLISDVNSDRVDGASALSQAEDIRKNYLDQMSQLKDGKTRRIALADVHRIDAKITLLKAAVKSQDQRKEKLAMLVPTFADGGDVSAFARKNFRNNPLGYITGSGTARSDSISAYFPIANSVARISHSEYVLDAETTRNIGVWNLDRLRAGKGKNFGEIARMMKHVHEPRIKLAEGGLATGTNSQTTTPASPTTEVSVSVENKIYPQEGSAVVQTDVWVDTPEGKRKLESKIEEIIYDGRSTGKIPTALNRVNNGQS